LHYLTETRYFTIKSYNVENIEAAHENCLWASGLDNGAILAEAFKTSKNVILFFSANMSHAYQGFVSISKLRLTSPMRRDCSQYIQARMTGPPSAANPKPDWYGKIKWPLCQPFKIEWLSKSTVETFHVYWLKNKLNEGCSVPRARDCQEMDDFCGRNMVRILSDLS
jgi:hypothetical protein